jgi:hypothetical protein
MQPLALAGGVTARSDSAAIAHAKVLVMSYLRSAEVDVASKHRRRSKVPGLEADSSMTPASSRQNIHGPQRQASRLMLLGQMLGHDRCVQKNILKIKYLMLLLAEREGFEPPIRLPVCRISSAVHSTTLPPLRGRDQSPVVVRGVLTKAVRRNKGGQLGRRLKVGSRGAVRRPSGRPQKRPRCPSQPRLSRLPFGPMWRIGHGLTAPRCAPKVREFQ